MVWACDEAREKKSIKVVLKMKIEEKRSARPKINDWIRLRMI
jgi:hypothetical protein